jgi:hypothetical protein
MKKIFMALAAVLALGIGQPAHAGVGFGIPLPFPFLVWTPSGHCGQGYHGSCVPKGQDRTTTIPKSPTVNLRAATEHTRPASTAKAAIAPVAMRGS